MLVLNKHPLWVIALFYIGLGLGTLSSTLVLILLISIKYKDFSTEIRLYSTIIDILSAIVYSFYPLTDTVQFCTTNYFFLFVNFLHGVWLFYMARSMYKIICKQEEKSRKNIKFAFALLFVFSSCVAVAIFADGKQENYCILNNEIKSIIYASLAIIFPDMAILCFIIYYYIKIFQVLKAEIMNCDLKSTRNRIYCKRLYGYPLLFLILIIANIFYICDKFIPAYFETFQCIRLILYAYYPFVDSLLYGFTHSTLKHFQSIFVRNSCFVEEQLLLNELREEGYLRPRFYLDFIGKGEKEVFSEFEEMLM